MKNNIPNAPRRYPDLDFTKEIGFAALKPSGETFRQAGATLVIGASREDAFAEFMERVWTGQGEFALVGLSAADIFENFALCGGAFAFDPEAYAIFRPFAIVAISAPIGTFLHSFDEAPLQAFVIHSGAPRGN